MGSNIRHYARVCIDCQEAVVAAHSPFFRCDACVFALPRVTERGITGTEMSKARGDRDRARSPEREAS